MLAAVAQVFNVSQDDLLGRKRLRQVVVARQAAMFLLNKELGLAVTRIGHLVGGKNHSTVIHGVSKISAEMATNITLRERIDLTREKINGTP